MPDVIALHVGSNDLGEIEIELVGQMKRDLAYLNDKFPSIKIVCPSITQRRVCGGCNQGTSLGAFMTGSGGSAIQHPKIRHDRPGLFSWDGLHIFLNNLALGWRYL